MNNPYLQTGMRVSLAALLALWLMSAVSASADTLLLRLRSDYAAMVSAEDDFRSRRARGTLNGNEAADYAAYVAGLHRRVAEDCVAMTDNGMTIPADLSCPDFPAEFIAPAAIDQTSEQTATEATATLDSELFAGLGEFDEMLLREQERVKAAAAQASAGSGGGGGGSSGSGDASDAGESGPAESAAGNESRYGEGAGPGSPRSTANSSAPPGTPNGSDDDVVARQLREAAEKETDPELKKKLWEEYRKYKKGTS
jgi:hypothetical protein